MTSRTRSARTPVRPDVHARFVAIRQRAEARAEEEQRALAAHPTPPPPKAFGREHGPSIKLKGPKWTPEPYVKREIGPQGWNDDAGW